MFLSLHRRIDRINTDRERSRASNGQAAIELAVIGLLLATMTFGAVEFGRAYFAATSVTNAARDAARVAMDPAATNADIIAAADSAADPIELSGIDIDRSTVEGEMSTITVTYGFTTVTPLVSRIWGGGPLSITESATSRVGWDK